MSFKELGELVDDPVGFVEALFARDPREWEITSGYHYEHKPTGTEVVLYDWMGASHITSPIRRDLWPWEHFRLKRAAESMAMAKSLQHLDGFELESDDA